MIYATEVIVKKIQRFTTEIKDKEYDKESVFIEHYQYEELYDKKHNVNAVICHFDGYTGLHSEEECITINEQLENIKKDKTLKPYWDYSPKEVPILEKFREDIYMFLASSKDKL